MLKINDRVLTPNGAGTIINYDCHNHRLLRYVVKLDIEKYTFNPSYWEHELKIIKEGG